jgi:hypothetical protein
MRKILILFTHSGFEHFVVNSRPAGTIDLSDNPSFNDHAWDSDEMKRVLGGR